MEGKIIKALSGFYYVAAEDGLYTCQPRGRFRKQGESPMVGDRVRFSLSGDRGAIEQILPRKNAFVRPAVANLDAIVIMASASIPVTEPFLIDRMTVIAERQNVTPIVCVNKLDLDPAEELLRIYRSVGYPVVGASARTGEGVEELRGMIRGKTVAFTGNSGVGKSAILSRLCPELELRTGEISQKLGRGRHTTRHIELFSLGDGTLAADTPGFSSFDVEMMDWIPASELEELFPEFRPYLGKCRFQDCSHRSEPDCAVRKALEQGLLEPTRHQSYRKLYELAEQRKPWEQKQN